VFHAPPFFGLLANSALVQYLATKQSGTTRMNTSKANHNPQHLD
jgi:hypothetical protein